MDSLVVNLIHAQAPKASCHKLVSTVRKLQIKFGVSRLALAKVFIAIAWG